MKWMIFSLLGFFHEKPYNSITLHDTPPNTQSSVHSAGMDMRPSPVRNDTLLLSNIAEFIRKKEVLHLLMNPIVSVYDKLNLLENIDMNPSLLNGGLLNKWNYDEF